MITHFPSDEPKQHRTLCGALTGEVADAQHEESVNCGLCLGLRAHKQLTGDDSEAAETNDKAKTKAAKKNAPESDKP